MSTYYTERQSVARKRWPCATCNEPAALPGERYTYGIWFADGRVGTIRQCLACWALVGRVEAWLEYAEEGVTQEDYAEWATRVARDEASPDYADAVAYLDRIGGAR